MRINSTIGLTFLAVLLCVSRLIPTIDPTWANLTPVLALAIFMPYVIDKKVSYILPLAVLLFTDLLIGFTVINLIVYLLVAFMITLSIKTSDWFITGLVGVLTWHIVINLFVYLTGDHGTTLAQTYIQAIPFDFRLLTSTMIYLYLFSLIIPIRRERIA